LLPDRASHQSRSQMETKKFLVSCSIAGPLPRFIEAETPQEAISNYLGLLRQISAEVKAYDENDAENYAAKRTRLRLQQEKEG